MTCEHPDRPHYARGMCRTCYSRARRVGELPVTAPRWPDEPKMPVLIDGQLTPAKLIAALAVLEADGPETPMTLAEVTEWLSLHVRRPPPPPKAPPPPGDRRRIRRQNLPAGRPGRNRSETRAAA